MPGFILWPFRRQNSRTTQDANEAHTRPMVQTPQPAPSEEAPPKYTTIATNLAKLSISELPSGDKARQALHEVEWRGPAEGAKPLCASVRLDRCIIEIIALTFHADFDALNDALHGDNGGSNTNTILTESERTTLTSLSHAVANAKRWMDAECPIPAKNKEYLFDALIKPGADKWCFADFTLDLFDWYGGTLSYPVPWGQTIPGIFAINDDTRLHLQKSEPCETTDWAVDQKPKQSMEAFLQAIHECSPNKKVQIVLEQAFEEYRSRFAYGAVKKSVTYWPIRKGYTKLLELIEAEKKRPGRTERCSKWRCFCAQNESC
ncbi:hypothetical protein HBI56_127620 [Parastagonospora nodorum]|uniref:Uncharacterized protein n=1 Tax=Phaeosphaeria nodorum (strain SN15 / ATCC MYA-4574 / FGSC 10173) TaxID=321614 RepID=A0A7U2I1U5_PHANO|nr:hypothetical protein HBH56_168980 [Parastagonospora nodorum]QRC98728.1 hypothetical protein JI435_047720 [Parastagonospora nodorum SN15]KAH3936298.1 hypothetical protein HBH54_032070 [Parastagonospora nodorum]KAH3948133.1 hypothetical protein HBH53_106840 [Parastagonospora nodorum]KAH3968750.1 hypothetical protein HBH51_130750 [Parastagonospora nodorum]